MVAAPLMNEADCLAHELRRTGSANYLDLTRWSAINSDLTVNLGRAPVEGVERGVRQGVGQLARPIGPEVGVGDRLAILEGAVRDPRGRRSCR